MIRLLLNDDIVPALKLCRRAGWNQLPADWLRLIEHTSSGCFVAERNNQIVGTVTTTRYGTELAWIGMMLVDDRFRRQGIGTQLLTAALDYLRNIGVNCIKLDATPTGQPVYEKLGFQVEETFNRWSRDAETFATIESMQLTESLSRTHLELDRFAFGTDRSDWLHQLAADSHVSVQSGGFGMLRAGFLANYVGPVVAETKNVAFEIIDELLNRSTGHTFWDVPHDNTVAVEIAQSLCFKPVRDLTRMRMGSKPVTPHMELQYALSDPGTG